MYMIPNIKKKIKIKKTHTVMNSRYKFKILYNIVEPVKDLGVSIYLFIICRPHD